MVSGNAQRPEYSKICSGKTISFKYRRRGRLVLADALTYTEEKYKPKFIVDLATLTGAIIVCLGSEYAGLFSSNDELSEKFFNAGKKLKKSLENASSQSMIN